MKRCPRCEQTKELSEFSRHNGRPDGRQSYCKACSSAIQRERAAKNPERTREIRRRSEKRNRDRHNTRHRKWYAENKDRRKEYERDYHEADPRRRRAKDAVKRAITAGTLIRLPCEVCRKEPAEGHHDDYDKPLDVRWLCKSHHRQHHEKVGRQEATGA